MQKLTFCGKFFGVFIWDENGFRASSKDIYPSEVHFDAEVNLLLKLFGVIIHSWIKLGWASSKDIY